MDGKQRNAVQERARPSDEWDRFEAIFALCCQARDTLGARGPFRLRVLLDMIVLELRKERVRLAREP